MKKRLIALTVLVAMLVSVSPAVAADDTVKKPTMEEILSEYHQKAFEAKVAEQTGGASANSRSASNSEKTLEEETVDALNAAGYEAYNVTSENYETLEQQLRTDFAQIGLDPDGSYIIAISGDENSPSNSTRGPNPDIVPTLPPDGGGPTSFEYTYNGKTYNMRYCTVTGADDNNYSKLTEVNLLKTYGENVLDRLLNAAVEIYLDNLNRHIPLGTIASILGLDMSNTYSTEDSILRYTAGTDWTRIYIQIWNRYDEAWHFTSSVEYVDMYSTLSGTFYNTDTCDFEDRFNVEVDKRVYSGDYYDTEQRKKDAVTAYLSQIVMCDTTGDVVYKHDGKVVVRHIENLV